MDELLHRRRDIVLPSYDSNKDMANQFSSFFLNKIEKIRDDLDVIQVLSPFNNSNDNNTLPPESLLDFASVSDDKVNKSINTGTFPSSFKLALVSPLIKKSTLDG